MIYLPSRTKRVQVDSTKCPSILPKDAETQTYSLPGAGEGGPIFWGQNAKVWHNLEGCKMLQRGEKVDGISN